MEARIIALVIFELFIIFVAAKIAAEIFERLGQPAVIGELLAGILIGPSVLGLLGAPLTPMAELFGSMGFSTTEAKEAAKESDKLILEVLAEIGVVILLFKVGLETNLNALMKLGGRALAVAAMGVIFPFVLGGGFIWILGRTLPEILFMSAAMVATSVGITARVLSDLGKLQTPEGRVILGAAVIDDVLGLLVLTVVLGVARPGAGGESVSILEIGGLIVVAFGFIVVAVLVGVFGVRRYSIHFEKLRIQNPSFAISLAVCLGLAALAAQIGLAAIIGAFLAGLIFGESDQRRDLEHAIEPLYQVLVPIFFVFTGTKVDVSSFANGNVLGVAVVITLLAIIGKFVGCGLAALSMGRKSAVIIGVGMAPRGEVGLIVAAIGLSNNIFTAANGLYSVVVIMSIVTTVIVPPLLTMLFASSPAGSGSSSGAEQEDEPLLVSEILDY